ncbi:MAG TPA: protein phosphatase 2C domain-containing protein [Flavipsychrobacter sp.]|nr:protein phosphatase 2C domain-containing protein [Flavipsychrobacter sp.]
MRFLFSRPKEETEFRQPSTEPAQPFMHCIVHSLSETGPVREHNEDHLLSYFLTDDRQQLLCVVADGMGGHHAGEIASQIACETMLKYTLQNRNDPPGNLLSNAIQAAHGAIRKAGNENPSQRGMGTTATAVMIKDNTLSFAHVGDSRLYHFSAGSLRQLSKDHTLVNQMYENGEISLAQRDTHAMRNVLLQALGTVNAIVPQTAVVPIALQVTDKLLLCSDGLYDVFSDAQLQNLMRMNDPALILECFRTIAMERRASDNFTAVLISFSDDIVSTTPITKEHNIMS